MSFSIFSIILKTICVSNKSRLLVHVFFRTRLLSTGICNNRSHVVNSYKEHKRETKICKFRKRTFTLCYPYQNCSKQAHLAKRPQNMQLCSFKIIQSKNITRAYATAISSSYQTHHTNKIQRNPSWHWSYMVFKTIKRQVWYPMSTTDAHSNT